MYTTSLKKWFWTVSIDTVLISGFYLGLFMHVPYILPIEHFFLWALTLVAVLFNGSFVIINLMCENAIENPRSSKELVDKSKALLAKFWSKKVTDGLAYSQTFFTYQWVSGIALMALYVVADYYVLAVFSVISAVIMSMMVALGRQHYDTQKST